MIELKKVSHGYDTSHTQILKNVNLAMRRGETFVVVGPSGEGKSTLLKILSGLIKPRHGEVIIDDIDLYNCDSQTRVKLMNKIGMLFQKNALFDSMTVGENLAFPLRETTKMSAKDITAQVKKYLSAVGLAEKEDFYPEAISGGQQKRVGIARALILDPEYIFYDDPTAGLDPITSRMIIELIIKLNKELGATSLTITNDMNRAYQLADRMGVLMAHNLTITGSVSETKKYPDPAIQNFIQGKFDESAN